MEMLSFYVVLVHELSLLIKYVFHQSALCCVCRSRVKTQLKNPLVVNRAKTPKPDTWRENPHVMMTSSCTYVHWVTPWGGEGREGR